MTWGMDFHIVERFKQAGVAGDQISMEKNMFLLRAPDKSPPEVVKMFRHFYGPTMNAFEAAEKKGMTNELERQLISLTEAQNTAEGGGTKIPASR